MRIVILNDTKTPVLVNGGRVVALLETTPSDTLLDNVHETVPRDELKNFYEERLPIYKLELKGKCR